MVIDKQPSPTHEKAAAADARQSTEAFFSGV